MKAFRSIAFAALMGVSIAACDKPAKLQVENTMNNAVLLNVRWGDVHVANELLPGENSATIRIYDDSYNNIDLPDEQPIRFHLDVNGDRIFLETRDEYRLDVEQSVTIPIDDTTRVFNPTLDAE